MKKRMFNLGDTVRVYSSKGQDSGIVSKILKIGKSSINGETVYGLENGYQYPERWLKLEKENNMFEVGDLVKYKNGQSVYEVTSARQVGGVKLRHLKSGKIYNEEVLSTLVKLKFKIGDKVKIIDEGAYKNIVTTITGASISSASGNLYYDTESCNVGFMDHLLELVTEKTPKFKKGDLVYVNPDKVITDQHHNVLQVISVNSPSVKCSNHELKKYSFYEDCLFKFKFQPGDIVTVISMNNIYYGKTSKVEEIVFIGKEIHYSLSTLCGWIREDELVLYEDCEVSISTKKTAGDITINEGITDRKIADSIFEDTVKESLSTIIGEHIINRLTNQSKNDEENQLQREEAPESGGDDSERVGVHGRRYQVAIRECYQRYKAGFSKGKKHIVRLKEQLSTSYSRNH